MNEERHWIITFSNGYCGCNQEEEFIGTYERASDYADERLRDYAERNFDWVEEYNEDDFEKYCESCTYEIEESEEEDED